MSMYGKNHYNTVISPQLIKINGKKIKRNEKNLKKIKMVKLNLFTKQNQSQRCRKQIYGYQGEGQKE